MKGRSKRELKGVNCGYDQDTVYTYMKFSKDIYLSFLSYNFQSLVLGSLTETKQNKIIYLEELEWIFTKWRVEKL